MGKKEKKKLTTDFKRKLTIALRISIQEFSLLVCTGLNRRHTWHWQFLFVLFLCILPWRCRASSKWKLHAVFVLSMLFNYTNKEQLNRKQAPKRLWFTNDNIVRGLTVLQKDSRIPNYIYHHVKWNPELSTLLKQNILCMISSSVNYSVTVLPLQREEKIKHRFSIVLFAKN